MSEGHPSMNSDYVETPFDRLFVRFRSYGNDPHLFVTAAGGEERPYHFDYVGLANAAGQGATLDELGVDTTDAISILMHTAGENFLFPAMQPVDVLHGRSVEAVIAAAPSDEPVFSTVRAIDVLDRTYSLFVRPFSGDGPGETLTKEASWDRVIEAAPERTVDWSLAVLLTNTFPTDPRQKSEDPS